MKRTMKHVAWFILDSFSKEKRRELFQKKSNRGWQERFKIYIKQEDSEETRRR
jgi:hypothetical protein